MVPLPSLAEIPQLQALQSQVRRLWAAQTVVVLASDRGLWIAWPSEQGWQVAAGFWPEGCCRDLEAGSGGIRCSGASPHRSVVAPDVLRPQTGSST